MPDSNCENYYEKLENLKDLHNQFQKELKSFETSRKSENIWETRKNIQEILDYFKKEIIPNSELFEELNLEEQYETRLNSLQSSGILEKLSNGEMGIIGIDGKEYTVPDLNQIKERIINKEEILKTKIEQGFIKILLVPFAMPITKLAEKYKETILKHHKNNTLTATNGDTLELDENDPLYVWDQYQNADINNNLVYYPQQFDPENHQGKTKQDLLNTQINQGWQILLIEDLPDLPAEGQGQEISGRKQLEDNKTPITYLEKIQTDPQYQNEQGLTPEDWLAYAITHLEETNQVIDDYDGQGKVNYNLGGYFPASGGVSRGYWSRDYRQADLSGDVAGDQSSYNGVRSGVSVF